jgi:hypothetical protein
LQDSYVAMVIAEFGGDMAATGATSEGTGAMGASDDTNSGGTALTGDRAGVIGISHGGGPLTVPEDRSVGDNGGRVHSRRDR